MYQPTFKVQTKTLAIPRSGFAGIVKRVVILLIGAIKLLKGILPQLWLRAPLPQPIPIQTHLLLLHIFRPLLISFYLKSNFILPLLFQVYQVTFFGS